MRSPNSLYAVWVAFFLVSVPAQAVWASDVEVSSDVTVDLSGVPVHGYEAAIDDLMGGIVIEDFGGLSDGADVDGQHREGCCVVYFSPDTTLALAGGVVARPEDVVRFESGSYALEFDGSLAGVPPGANVDAVSLDGEGRLALSFDITIDLGGLVVADEDVVRFDGAGFSLLLDGSAAGLDPSLDVDGVHELGPGVFAISVDGSGAIGGARIDDEDILLIDLAGPVATVLLDASAFHAGWPAADLDAVALPEPGVTSTLPIAIACLLPLAARRRCPRSQAP